MKTLTEAVKACGGVWPSDPLEGVGVGWHGKSTEGEPDFIQLGIGGPEFTRPEFEAEAARLSGKPGWGEAPEWAQSLAQFPDGQWIWLSTPSPMERDHGWADMSGETSTIQNSGQGVILSDWRNTLERRPEVEVESKPDPMPVGWHGEATYGTRECWRTCVILPDGFAAVELDDRWVISKVDNWEFRPLKSDRERWVEAANELGSKSGPSGRIYDALISGELPMPEAK